MIERVEIIRGLKGWVLVGHHKRRTVLSYEDLKGDLKELPAPLLLSDSVCFHAAGVNEIDVTPLSKSCGFATLDEALVEARKAFGEEP